MEYIIITLIIVIILLGYKLYTYRQLEIDRRNTQRRIKLLGSIVALTALTITLRIKK